MEGPKKTNRSSRESNLEGKKKATIRKKLRRRSKLFWLKHDWEDIITLGFTSSLPQRKLVMGFGVYSFLGTMLLLMPFAHRGDFISTTDHFFTAVSAITTTGLSTVDIASTYTFFGQLVILLLIQIGGIGYMTMSSYVMYRMTRHFMDKKDKLLRIEFTMPVEMPLRDLVTSIVYFTLLIEAVGALLLSGLFFHLGVETPIWHAIFHSISAFCTAGFTTLPQGLIPFQNDVMLNLILSVLSLLGAMGFIFMSDVYKRVSKQKKRMTFTTRNIIFVTILVVGLGTLYLTLFDKSLAYSNHSNRLLAAFFHITSAMSTAGFNTIDLGAAASSTALISLIMAMLIGASPSGTGGGLKSTTVTAVFAFVKSKLSMRRHTYLLNHRIPSFRVENATATFILYSTVLFLGTFLLIAVTPHSLRLTPFRIFFEATSALGTVGLSTGITASFTDTGKLILCALMFGGRIGMLSIGQAMQIRMKRSVDDSLVKEDDLAV